MKQKTWTRLLALLLSIAMVMTCLPLTVFAADDGGGRTQTITVAKAQLGTNASFGGDQVDLSNALYTFETNGDGYTISNTIPGTGTTVYLNIVGGGATIPNQANANDTAVALTNVTVDSALWFRFDDGSSLHFHTESSGNNVRNFNRCSTPCGVKHNFALFRAANEDETSSTDIPGYVRLTEAGQVEANGEYLIATKAADGSWYVLYPSNSTSDKYAHVAKVVLVQEEVEGPGEDETPARTPQDAINEGYDVHYFIKSGGVAGKGWTFSDTADSVTIGTGGATTTPVKGAFDDATSYQIYVGPSSYLFAPYGTAKSTAQGNYDGGSTDFNIIANGDGTYKIKAEDNYFMTQKPSDFMLGSTQWKGVQFGANGDDFYITPVNDPNNGAYWIWYQTEKVTVVKTALAAAIAEAATKAEADYTADSWAALQTALANANTVNGNADATQAQVDEALAALTGAIAALVEKTVEPEPTATPEPVEKPRHYFAKPAAGADPWTIISNGTGIPNLLSYQISGSTFSPDLAELGETEGKLYRTFADGNGTGKGFLTTALVDGVLVATAGGGYPTAVLMAFEKQPDDNMYILSIVKDNVTYYLTAETKAYNGKDCAVFSANEADAVPYFIDAVPNGTKANFSIYCVGPYTVSFNGGYEGAEDIAPISAMYGTTLPTLTREGYKFLGWFNGDEKFTEVTADVTLTAKWEEVSSVDPVETIEHHEPTAGMIQHYLHYVSPGWGGPTTKAALELHNVANGVYTKDTDGIINSGVYGIYDTNPGDGGSERWMHAGSGVTNQCAGNTCGAPHQFTFTYDAEKKAYTIQSLSTGAYLTQTASGNQLAMNSTPTYFYIDPVEGSAGSYYIWWETEAVLGDAISGMMTANEANNENTWAFVGGRAVQGSFDDIGLARTLAGQFEEYIRWEKRGGSSDEGGSPWAMQRYVTNTAYTGQTLAHVVSDAGWARVTALAPRAAVYMVGDEDIGSTTFEADLTSFITKSLALRDGNGFAVIIKGYKTEMTELNATVDTAVNALSGSQKSRVAVVDGTLTAEQLSNGYPNAKGHLELAKKLAAAVVGSTNNFPTGRNDATAIANGTWASKLTDNGVTIFGETPETLTAAQQAVKDKVDDKTTAMTWLFMGDSITHGALWAEGDGTISQDFEKFVKDDLGRTSDVVINTAVSGATSATTVREIQARLNKYDPDVVSIMIGTNDAAGKRVTVADYKTNLNTILTAISNKDAIAVLRTPIPNGSSGRGNYIHEYVDAIWEVYNGLSAADKEKVIVVDQFAQWAPYLMTADDGYGTTFLFGKVFDQDGNKIHPGPVGHLWMTQELIDGLGLWDSSKNLCKLSYQENWGITSAESAVSLADACTYDADSRTLSVSLSSLGLSGTVISAELTAVAGGETYTDSYLRGQEGTLTITFPEGADSAQISAAALVSENASTGKKVSFASAEVNLSSSIEHPKMPAPVQPESSYEYRRASGEFTEGTYAIVGTSVMSGDKGRIRVMHLADDTINHCQINTKDTPGGEILTIDHETHLLNAAKSGGGYTFQVAAGNNKGQYLNGSGSTLSLSGTATVFTVSPLAGGGYNLSWTSNGSTYYIAWTGNFRTGSTTPYKLNLYRKTEVPLSMAQTEFSGTSTDGPMNESQTNSTFRIPALVTLDNGWIVAASDIRWPNTADSPNNLDTIVSVSKDGGKTWDWEIVNYFSDFAPLHGVGQKVYSASFIDPALAVDGDGTLWMAVDLQPAHVNLGQNAQKTGSGFDENGYLMVGPISESEWETKVNTSTGRTEATRLQYQANYEYRVDINSVDHTTDVTTTKNGKTVSLYPVFHKDTGANTGYYVDAFFDLYYDYDEGGIKPVLVAQKESSDFIQANLFYVQSPWKAYSTTYLMIRKATVNEATGKLDWEDPMLVSGVKNFDGETFLAFCPGRGTVTTVNGKERIIFPVYDNVNGEKSSVVYSDDGGKTWTRGERIPNGAANKTSESQIVVLPDGNGGTFLRIYSRNTNPTISYADSYDGGATWSAGKLDSELKYGDNTMVSFINLEGLLVGPDGTVYENLILASYPWGTKESGEHRRSNGVVRIGSFDPVSKDVTWLNENEIRYPGRFNYSCLTQLLDENNKPTDGFGLLYEVDGGKGMLIPFDILTARDLLGEGWNLVQTKPTVIPTISASTDLVDLDLDGTETVTAAATPDGINVAWDSDNESVATVENGIIRAVSAGKAYITASVNLGGVIRKAVVEVVVQNGGIITLPDRYSNKLNTAIVPAKTQYELDTDGDLSGVYAIFSQGSGARIMYNNTSATNHCMASPVNGVLASISCHTTNLHLWNVAKQADGTYTIRGVSNNKYLTATANGTQLALGDSPVSFTITHQGNGTYYVSNGGSYLAWNNGWKMQSTAFNIQFFEQVNYEASESYTTNADGLKAVIAALDDEAEADYAGTLALVTTYTDKAEADEAQAKIDALTKQLYRKLRGDSVTVTFKVGDEEFTRSVRLGTALGAQMPEDPANLEEGLTFQGWFVGNEEFTAATKVYGDIEVTAKLGASIPEHIHTPGDPVRENEAAATCTADGSYDEVVYCTECGEELSRESRITDEALGHIMGATVRENMTAATCETDGSFDEVAYCAECGEELSRESKTIEKLGHTAGEAVRENEAAATCTAEGSYDEVVYCTMCDEEFYRKTITVEATGHTIVIDPEVAATETSSGLTAGSHCDVCGTVFVQQKTIPMLGADPDAPVVSIVPTTPNTPDIPDNPDDPGEEIDDPETPLANLPFIDVDADAWYAESVAYVYSKDIMHGMSDMIFEPKASFTRGMMAQIMHNMAENPKTDTSSIFSDLNNRYYTEAVAWGVANGVLKGYSEDTFGGEDDLTREQMAVMLYRYAQVQGLSNDVDVAALDSFADSEQVSGWAKEAMAWAVKNGLLKGRGNNDLDPRTNITRSEVAAVLERYLKMFLA